MMTFVAAAMLLQSSEAMKPVVQRVSPAVPAKGGEALPRLGRFSREDLVIKACTAKASRLGLVTVKQLGLGGRDRLLVRGEIRATGAAPSKARLTFHCVADRAGTVHEFTVRRSAI